MQRYCKCPTASKKLKLQIKVVDILAEVDDGTALLEDPLLQLEFREGQRAGFEAFLTSGRTATEQLLVGLLGRLQLTSQQLQLLGEH